MPIRATCDQCGRDFLFLQLHDGQRSDMCPHCDAHLGIANIRHLALATDRALHRLVQLLELLASGSPRFRVKPESVLARIQEATDVLASPGDEDRKRRTAA